MLCSAPGPEPSASASAGTSAVGHRDAVGVDLASLSAQDYPDKPLTILHWSPTVLFIKSSPLAWHNEPNTSQPPALQPNAH